MLRALQTMVLLNFFLPTSTVGSEAIHYFSQSWTLVAIIIQLMVLMVVFAFQPVKT